MIPIFYSVMLVAIVWFALLFASSRLGLRGATRRVDLAIGVVTVLLVCLPLGGLRLGSWAFSVCPNPSLPLLGIACAGLWQRFSGVAIFKPADWRATWMFGAVAGSALYLHPMLFGSLDLYYWGWDNVSARWCLAAVAVVFLAFGNRFGVLLLAALMAHAVDALESANCWDYVIDPFYWLIGVCAVVTQGASWCLARRSLARPPRRAAA